MALEGLVVPMPTLFGSDGAIDPSKNARFTRSLCDARVDHVFVLGTTGEFPLVAAEERASLLEAVLETLGWHTDGWVGCGAPATNQAMRFAVQAEEAGASALLAVPPYYLVPTEASLKHYYREIRRVTALPLLAYNIPSHVGYALTPPVVHELAREKVLSGIKDTSGSLDSVQGFIHGAPEGFVVLPGDDALAAASIALGSPGAIMGSANVLPKLAGELVRAARAQESEKLGLLQNSLESLLRVLHAGPFPSTVKYLAQKLRGADVGYRSPYDPLTAEEEARVNAELSAVETELRAFV